MSFKTGNKKTGMWRPVRYFSIVVSIILIMSVLVAPTAFSATSMPSVKNAAGLAYADKGSTRISDSVDVRISHAANTQYYYLLQNRFVEAYYNGATDNPAGSYFDGSLINGAFVTEISQDPTNISGIPIGSAENWTITIPKPENGQRYELKVVSYMGGEPSPVFSHSFYGKAPFVVTDGDGTVYDHNARTGISDTIDVFITPAEDDDEYYYTFGALSTADAYYAGETNNPVGSYLDGSLVSGNYVTTMSPNPNIADMTRVNEESGWKITVPKPTAQNPSVLKIVSRSGGISTLIYTHTFALPYVGSAKFGSRIEAKFENNNPQAVSGRAFAAVYDKKGVLIAVEGKEFNAPSYDKTVINFNLDLSLYPASDYTYKVFFWDSNLIPLIPEIKN